MRKPGRWGRVGPRVVDDRELAFEVTTEHSMYVMHDLDSKPSRYAVWMVTIFCGARIVWEDQDEPP